ncbi:MAG: DEAD/DEAH box helicase [Arcanobacterium sp.]|nr:DEAD/DEAH box helicase [Arcanobacterium sp.]
MEALIEYVEKLYSEQISAVHKQESRESRTTSWPAEINPELIEVLATHGITKPWSHQAELAEVIISGKNAVLATGTGSGKSLAVWVPILSDLLNFSYTKSLANLKYRPTSLYLAPTKALAADQEQHLSELNSLLNNRIGITTVDGDADNATRSWARDYGDIILSNPDFIHFGILANHQRWQRFFRGLKYIIVDEFHNYRGSFGANVSLILRRLLRVAQHYRANPQIIFLSATSQDPQLSAQRFIGEASGEVIPITEDGSPRGARYLIAMNRKAMDNSAQDGSASPAYEENSKGSFPSRKKQKKETEPRRRSLSKEAAELTAKLVDAEAQVLTFVRSRAGTEHIAELSREYSKAEHKYSKSETDEQIPLIQAYRGGYLPEERRDLEKNLRNGKIRALITTSALELGIDVSGLDAVITAGWPGTFASYAQQSGRAGRAGRSGLSIYIASDNPLDQFLLTQPERLFLAPPEQNTFDPNNPWIFPPHLCAAAAELPLTERDCVVFGLKDSSLFTALAEQGLLKHRPNGWYWNTSLQYPAHELVDVRGENNTISIIDLESGALLGTVDGSRAHSTVHPGAIYLHQGKSFQVEQLLSDTALVSTAIDSQLRTFARESETVEIFETPQWQRRYDGFTCNYGNVTVSSQVVGYDMRRNTDGMHLGAIPLELPKREFITTGTWIELDSEVIKAADIAAPELPGALHAAEHALIGLLPLFANCDRWDLGGLSTALHPDTGKATIIVHDSVPGGSGCAQRGYQIIRDWVAATKNVIAHCDCFNGCPSCVYSPKCGNNNQPISKAAALRLLSTLSEQFPPPISASVINQ